MMMIVVLMMVPAAEWSSREPQGRGGHRTDARDRPDEWMLLAYMSQQMPLI